MRKTVGQTLIRTRREVLEEQGYHKFELRNRETGEVEHVCWAKTRRNAVRQWRYHRNKNREQDSETN